MIIYIIIKHIYDMIIYDFLNDINIENILFIVLTY